MSSPSTSWTEPPVDFGRPSAASEVEPALRPAGDAATASWRAEGASTSWCALRAASVTGVRHRLAGEGPEDSFAWAHGGDWLVVAVADGVGSTDGAAGAAARACRAAVDAGLAAAGEGSAEEAVGAAISAANQAAQGGGAATVAVAVLRSDGAGAAGRVGDSSAFLVSGDRAEELFTPPDPERADTATAAVPATDVAAELVELSVPAGAALVLATDGVADPWRDGPTTAGPALVAGLRRRPGPVELLLLADFSRQGCHDDRTLLGVWPTT